MLNAYAGRPGASEEEEGAVANEESFQHSLGPWKPSPPSWPSPPFPSSGFFPKGRSTWAAPRSARGGGRAEEERHARVPAGQPTYATKAGWGPRARQEWEQLGQGASVGTCGPAIRSLWGSHPLGGTWVVEAGLFCRGEERAAGPSGQRRWRGQLSKGGAGHHSWTLMGAIQQNHLHPRVEEAGSGGSHHGGWEVS